MLISQNQPLFALLGTVFGGDGRVNYLLPNLQGRTPVGFGNGIAWGQVGGEERHTLVPGEVPMHTHQLNASTANTPGPGGNLLGSGALVAYTDATGVMPMNAGTLSPAGSGQAHENRQPYLAMNWLIALTGIFPSRS
jgi:microcystin-dependent protein